MAKIYPDKDDVINILTNNIPRSNPGTIKFDKKYFKIQNYLLNFYIFPVVLVPIIMDYVNDVYIITCFWDEPDIFFVKQITKNNNKLLKKSTHTYDIGKNMYCAMHYHRRADYVSIDAEINLFKSFEEKTINASDEYSYSLLEFFNYFMQNYYSKKNYFLNEYSDYYKKNGWLYERERDDCIKRKIHNPKELRNIIIIFKILSKILTKV
jgi:hypothetical protein